LNVVLDFKGFSEFLIKILPNFLYRCLFSQLHRTFFPPKYRGKVLEGEVAEAAEEISWIAKRIKGRSSKLLRDQFPKLKEWCPGQFYADFPKGNQILQSKIGQYWAPSCYHGSVGHGWEVVERYISGQKDYEKIDTVPVIAEEKEKTHKTWYTSLYNKLFGGKHQK
jgi:hypothetical protein